MGTLLPTAALLAASSVALAEEIQWESPDGSFPDHGSCHYLGASGSLAAGGGVSGDLQRSTTRTLETQRVLAMLPPRRDARIPFQSQRDPLLAAASAGTCSGIDDCVEQTAAAAGVALADLTTDAEFLRRATLDLTGRIPTKQDVLAFLADTSGDKREAAVDSLLERSEWADRWAMFFGDHFRNTWRTAQVNRYQNGRDSFHLYLLESMRENKPYDQVAREVLAAEGTSDGRVYPERFETAEQHTNTYRNYEDNPVRASAVGYVVGGRTDGGPIQDTYDTLAFFTARDFLGVSTLECVLCHDGANHLEDVSLWGTAATRLQAWQMAAFFADIPRLQSWRVPRSTLPLGENGIRVVANYYTIRDLDPGEQDVSRHGDTAGDYLAHTDGGNRPDRWYDERYVQPQYPFERAATIDSGLRLREQLGAHLTADPQFARAAVNYIWKEFFSRGIVEPAEHFDLERMDPGSPPPTGWEVQPSHPHLLDWLAENFRDNGFDLKWLMRAIATSQTYQLSSRYDGVFSPQYEQYFVRHQAKRLSAEQIHDAIITATGRPLEYRASRSIVGVQYAMQFPDVNDMPPGDAGRLLNLRSLLRAFLPGDRDTTRRSTGGSLLQALNLMNNPFVPGRIGANALTGTLFESLALDDDELVANLYLTVLSRPPTVEETDHGVDYLADLSGTTTRRDRAVDLMWALFNKTEFYTNY